MFLYVMLSMVETTENGVMEVVMAGVIAERQGEERQNAKDGYEQHSCTNHKNQEGIPD